MIHAREDWNGRIVDLEKKIPEDEPVFMVRAQDKHAASTIHFYANLVRQDMEADQRIVTLCEAHETPIEEWPKKKSPDLPDQTPEPDPKNETKG